MNGSGLKFFKIQMLVVSGANLNNVDLNELNQYFDDAPLKCTVPSMCSNNDTSEKNFVYINIFEYEIYDKIVQIVYFI